MFGFGGFGNAPPAAASSPHSSSEFNFGGSGGTLNSSSATLAAAQSNVRLKVQAKVQDYLINVLEEQLTKEIEVSLNKFCFVEPVDPLRNIF